MKCFHEVFGECEFIKPVLNNKKILGKYLVAPPSTAGDTGLNGNPNLRSFSSAQCFTRTNDPVVFTAEYT